MFRVPFGLSSIGYVQAPNDPALFTNSQGHPFYPVRIEADRFYNEGECERLIAEAAYRAGVESQRGKS